MKKVILIAVVGLILIFVFNYAYTQERITLSTYYPAPYGEYRKLAIGSSTGGYTAPTASDIDLVVEGSVGIGTTAPGAKLYVYGNSLDTVGVIESDASSARLRLDHSGVGSGSLVDFFSAGSHIGQLGFYGGGTTLGIRAGSGDIGNPEQPHLVITNTGNVGIGTTNPSSDAPLEVVGSPWSLIRAKSNTSDGGILSVQSSTNEWQFYSIGSDVRIWETSGDRVTVQTGGNVGIGTTNPAAKLEINMGNSEGLRIIGTGGVGNTHIGYNGQDNYITHHTSGATYIRSYTGTLHNAPMVTFSGTGKVGIGTTNPTNGKLEVNGEISTGDAGIRWKKYVLSITNAGGGWVDSGINTDIPVSKIISITGALTGTISGSGNNKIALDGNRWACRITPAGDIIYANVVGGYSNAQILICYED